VPETIDVDSFDELLEGSTDIELSELTTACKGILVEFPAGKNHHTSYPFGLHNERIIPWDYHSINDAFYIQAKSCQKPRKKAGMACDDCRALTSTTIYEGIINRIEHGVHESTPLVYHGVGGLVTAVRRRVDQVQRLRMIKLNDSRKLQGKAAVLDDHKQWILAIVSGRVDRVASLVQAGLKHHAGIRSLILQYERAADKLYKPKGFTNEDIMRSLVMLRLGGARVAEFAHRSLSLPSLTTIRRNTVIRPLLVSPSAPTIAEVEANILICYETLPGSVNTTQNRNQGSPDLESSLIMHQVIMLDELAAERRIRWDDSTDKFQGSCREHNHKVSLTFSSEKELDLLCDALQNNEVHLASEVRLYHAERHLVPGLTLSIQCRQRLLP
jgi:hypothetical protein